MEQTSGEYLENLEETLSPEPFTEKLRDDLKEMLSTKALRLAYQHVMSESFASAGQILAIDLTEQSGVSAAIKQQGKVEGLQRALDIIFECSINTETEGEQDGEE